MKKESVLKYLLRFAVCNIASLLIYEVAFQVLNLITGGAVAIYSGAMESSGYSPKDLTPSMRAFVPIVLIVLAISVFFLFYLLMFLSVKRNKGIRAEFVRSIGADPFDKKAYAKRFFQEENGRTEFIYFAILTVIGAISGYFYVPVLSFIFQPQTVLTFEVLSLLAWLGTPVSLIFPAAFMILVNLLAYYFYLSMIIPRLYDKWASERLRQASSNE